MFLHRLTEEGKFYEAARKCQELLGEKDSVLWDRWIFVFAKADQLSHIAHYIPTAKPKLRDIVYEMVLSAFLRPLSSSNEHEHFLDLVERWPPEIYDVSMPSQALPSLASCFVRQVS